MIMICINFKNIKSVVKSFNFIVRVSKLKLLFLPLNKSIQVNILNIKPKIYLKYLITKFLKNKFKSYYGENYYLRNLIVNLI